MNTFFIEIALAMLSTLGGISLKDIKKVFDKEKTESAENLEISESIDIVSKKLEDSKEIIEVALFEMKKEAEISQQITSMNQEQVTALNKLLESTLNRQEKKAFPKTFLWNLFFCILSAILGFALGKFL